MGLGANIPLTRSLLKQFAATGCWVPVILFQSEGFALPGLLPRLFQMCILNAENALH